MSIGSSIFHKPGCPMLLYPGASCTCEIKEPVPTQLERIENWEKMFAERITLLTEIVEKVEESQGKLYSMQLALAERVDRMVAGLTAGQNALKGQLQGTSDAIATALGEQSKKLQTIDALATGWEAKFSKSKGRKHGKRRK